MMVRRVAIIFFMAIVVVGLWSVFKPQPPQANADPKQGSLVVDAASISTVEAQPRVQGVANPMKQSRVFELAVKAGKLVEGPAVLHVREGDQVDLQVTSDSGDELHVHGYDLHARL